jgi:hypothetical protein
VKLAAQFDRLITLPCSGVERPPLLEAALDSDEQAASPPQPGTVPDIGQGAPSVMNISRASPAARQSASLVRCECPAKIRASYKIRPGRRGTPDAAHAVRRRPRLFVGDIGVARETSMMIDGSPPVGAVPDEFATGFAAPLDFLEALLFRGQ